MAQSCRTAMVLFALLASAPIASTRAADGGFRPVPLQSRIARVQPMTGIVFWADSEHNATDAILDGNDQPQYQKMERIREAGQACGYDLRVTSFTTDGKTSRITVANDGVAPLYHDAFIAVRGIRAKESLKGLAPGKERPFEVAAPGQAGQLSIASDRLVPGQSIEFEADLK